MELSHNKNTPGVAQHHLPEDQSISFNTTISIQNSLKQSPESGVLKECWGVCSFRLQNPTAEALPAVFAACSLSDAIHGPTEQRQEQVLNSKWKCK